MTSTTTNTTRRSINSVKAQVLTCVNCELSSECRQPIPLTAPGYIDPAGANPKFLVLGEAPGQMEDRKGEPFVGPAGRYLKSAMKRVGIWPSDGIYLNTVSCFPAKRGTPTPDHVNACRINLYDQLDLYPNLPLLICGSVATRAVLPQVELAYASGEILSFWNRDAMIIYHPSYILRSRMVEDAWLRHLGIFQRLVYDDYRPEHIRCIYCTRQSCMPGAPYCTQHHSKWKSDTTRKKVKVHEPTLF